MHRLSRSARRCSDERASAWDEMLSGRICGRFVIVNATHEAAIRLQI
jgi:hypothetical protein